jgi:hypothetical protein
MANHHKNPASASYDPPIAENITSAQNNQNTEVPYMLKGKTQDNADG